MKQMCLWARGQINVEVSVTCSTRPLLAAALRNSDQGTHHQKQYFSWSHCVLITIEAIVMQMLSFHKSVCHMNEE